MQSSPGYGSSETIAAEGAAGAGFPENMWKLCNHRLEACATDKIQNLF